MTAPHYYKITVESHLPDIQLVHIFPNNLLNLTFVNGLTILYTLHPYDKWLHDFIRKITPNELLQQPLTEYIATLGYLRDDLERLTILPDRQVIFTFTDSGKGLRLLRPERFSGRESVAAKRRYR